MNDPYAVLGVAQGSDDATIRRRYLELVKQHSPENHPERFAQVRQAYEVLRNLDSRVRHRLFEAGKGESVEAIVEDLASQAPRRRLSLADLLNGVKKA